MRRVCQGLKRTARAVSQEAVSQEAHATVGVTVTAGEVVTAVAVVAFFRTLTVPSVAASPAMAVAARAVRAKIAKIVFIFLLLKVKRRNIQRTISL